MYRIKRIAALAAAAAMVLTLGSCGKGAETALTATADDAPVFMLSSLPDIGKYEPAQNYKRYSDSYCGTLTHGNYGTLIPFVGRDSEFSPPEDPETVINESLYGLMTVDGKVVVPATAATRIISTTCSPSPPPTAHGSSTASTPMSLHRRAAK